MRVQDLRAVRRKMGDESLNPLIDEDEFVRMVKHLTLAKLTRMHREALGAIFDTYAKNMRSAFLSFSLYFL